MERPSHCLNRHPLRWLTDNVAVCEGHPNMVWLLVKRGRRYTVRGDWNQAAVELAAATTDALFILEGLRK